MFAFFARRFSAALLVGLGATTAVARPALTQGPQHVTVALVDRIADSAVATIVRSPGPGGQTLILLRDRDANAVTLGSAMMAMYKIRDAYGDTVGSRLVVNVYGRRRPGNLQPNEQRLAAYYLRRLRRAPTVSLENVGSAKTVEVAVAPPSRRMPPLK
jgi:hypothetical protein